MREKTMGQLMQPRLRRLTEEGYSKEMALDLRPEGCEEASRGEILSWYSRQGLCSKRILELKRLNEVTMSLRKLLERPRSRHCSVQFSSVGL